jgi:hypothetical protein
VELFISPSCEVFFAGLSRKAAIGRVKILVNTHSVCLVKILGKHYSHKKYLDLSPLHARVSDIAFADNMSMLKISVASHGQKKCLTVYSFVLAPRFLINEPTNRPRSGVPDRIAWL